MLNLIVGRRRKFQKTWIYQPAYVPVARKKLRKKRTATANLISVVDKVTVETFVKSFWIIDTRFVSHYYGFCSLIGKQIKTVGELYGEGKTLSSVKPRFSQIKIYSFRGPKEGARRVDEIKPCIEVIIIRNVL